MHKNLLSHIRMGKEILRFGEIEIKRNKFYRNKTSTFSKDVDTEEVLVSNKVYFGEKIYKYFIGYLYNDHEVKPLHIILPETMLPKKLWWTNNLDVLFDWSWWLFKKYNTIWDKVSADIDSESEKNKIDGESVYNKEFSKAKIKSHGDEVTDFYDKKSPKVDTSHTCLAVSLDWIVITLDFALKKDKNYYTQAFLKECKHPEKKYLDILLMT